MIERKPGDVLAREMQAEAVRMPGIQISLRKRADKLYVAIFRTINVAC